MQQQIDKRYHVIKLLGGGGMARVYLAEDTFLKRKTALKVLRDQYADQEEFVERFKREAAHAASLSHPNIVRVYGQGKTEDGTHYIVMEFVSGGTLHDRIRQGGRLTPRAAATTALQVTEALRMAHEHGIVHRDIKPQNILMTQSGSVKVADFGIARAASVATLTQTGFILGSACYMSPEQVLGQRVDPRSDLYSLGVVLYEMLTGAPPYDAESPIATAMKHVNERLLPPRYLNPLVPEDLDATVTKLLAKDPTDRYENAAELVARLQGLSGAGAGGAHRPATGGHRNSEGDEAEAESAIRTSHGPASTGRNNASRMIIVRPRGGISRLLRTLVIIVLLLLLLVVAASLGQGSA